MPSRSPHSNGWTGTTIAASWSRSATSRQWNAKRLTIHRSRVRRWPPDSNQRASGIPGAVQSFAFETTLSGKRYAARIQQWKQDGWHIHMIFLRLESSKLAIQRVQKRVRLGGHDIPPRTVIRRYDAGLTNLREIYLPIVDSWSIYDNSGLEPVLLEHGTHAT